MQRAALVALWTLAIASCDAAQDPPPIMDGSVALTGATIIDGTGGEPIVNGTVLIRDGRIAAVGPADAVDIPAATQRLELTDKHVMPGIINAHGHIGDTLGIEGGHYSEANVLLQLQLSASYGVTTVLSLGGDGVESIRLRDAEAGDNDLARARLLVAGAVVTGNTPEEATAAVEANAALGVDFIKIRVDDNLASSEKMSPDIYGAVINRAHELGLRVAAHLFYLQDAKGLLDAGVDLIAHAVRDTAIDNELIEKLRETGVCYIPTLMREVSTFVYEDRPDFFDDAFFLRSFPRELVTPLETEESRARFRDNAAAKQYKIALGTAQANLGALSRAGIPIAMGTDSGPPLRFQGYFEHLELELMADAGMSPAQILRAATSDAARCVGLNNLLSAPCY